MKNKEMFSEITNHLLNDTTPSEYLKEVFTEEISDINPFDMLYKLQKIEQSPVYHPEGNVWNHIMLVVDEAAKIKGKSSDPVSFMWAALLHDIGKLMTTRYRKGRITSYDHDKVGEGLAVQFLSALTEDKDFINKVSKLVRYHMHVLYVVKNLPFTDVRSMLAETDVNDVALLGYCDRMGRLGSISEDVEKTTEMFLCKVQRK